MTDLKKKQSGSKMKRSDSKNKGIKGTCCDEKCTAKLWHINITAT